MISAPLFIAASTTTTPSLKPLIILFLLEKWYGATVELILYSDNNNPPFSNILFDKCKFCFGRGLSTPEPSTAIVLDFPLIQPMCEYASIPIANPLTILTPYWDS